MDRAEKVIAFCEAFLHVPEGKLVGEKLKLDEFQKKFIKDIYNNKVKTRRAILSIARKNGKSAMIAALLLAHLVGPEAKQNAQIISGAMSRDQASLVFNLAAKMVRFSPYLSKLVRIVPSKKMLIGIPMNVEYKALSAEAKTSHGLSPVLAILDELGQIRGPQDDFVDAITTSQGAHEDPLLIVISTQAPNDNDLLSVWIDDALTNKDKQTVCHLYTAPKDCEIMDKKSWAEANPALKTFRSLEDIEEQAFRAARMPSAEPTFRNLVLNQRIETISPFISRGVWLLNSQEINDAAFYESDVYIGLDLSAKTDLTAMVLAAYHQDKWHIKAKFWTPEKGLRERAKRDRAPYDIWADQGFITSLPGASIDYEHLAKDIAESLEGMNVAAIGFDRWRFDILKKEFDKLGVELPLEPFGQGFKDMAPAIDALESLLLNEKISHGNNPVLTMCMANARIEKDAAGNRKMNKFKATGRIDGAVALTMAIGVASKNTVETENLDEFIMSPLNLKV